MKKGILIVGEEDGLEMKLLEQQLALRLRRKHYPVEQELFWEQGQDREVIKFRKKGQLRQVPADQVIFLEKDMRKIYIHLEGKEPVGFYSGLEEVKKHLGPRFCHCHKSFFINMDKVEQIQDNDFVMKDGTVIPIGQRRKSEVVHQFKGYQEQKNLEKQRFFESFSCFEI